MRLFHVMKYYLILLLMSQITACKGQDSSFTPARVHQSAEITLEGPVTEVFPLFGIMREKEWDSAWNPTPVFPISGDMAEGAIYHTPGHLHGEAPLIWIVYRYDTSRYWLTYLVSASNRIVSIDIQCTPIEGNKTHAVVTYTMTGLTEEGNQIIRHHLTMLFAHHLQDWQDAINQRLRR
jgi:hypothetical protein